MGRRGRALPLVAGAVAVAPVAPFGAYVWNNLSYAISAPTAQIHVKPR